jgi:Flp pilus assembly protein TadD
MLDFDAGRHPDAYRRLDEVLKQQPKNEAALQLKVRFLLAEGKNKDALTVTDALVAADATSSTNQYLHGVSLEATGAIDQAVAVFQEILKRAPSSPAVQEKLATIYLLQGNARDALALSEQVVKAQPQSVPAHHLYAQSLLKSGDLTNAERELQALAKAVPSAAEIHTTLGMLYEAKGDVKRARIAYQKAFDLQPKGIGALTGLVSTDFASKQPAAALARIESRLAESPNDVLLVMLSAMAYTEVRDLPKAETAYRKVLALDPNNFDAYGRLGAIYLAEHRLDDARKSFEEQASHESNPVAAETMLGIILTNQAKPAEARTHFARALAINPRAGVAANNLAWDYATNGGNLDAALQLAQTAKAAMPNNASVTDTLGWIYYKKGLDGLAVTALREAAQQSPSDPGIHYHLGLAYLRGGKNADARATLQQVLKLNPQFPEADDVRRALATIKSSVKS